MILSHNISGTSSNQNRSDNIEAMPTTLYGKTGPVREHLLRPQGIAGEIRDLREDVSKSTGNAVQLVDVAEGPNFDELTTSGISVVRNLDPAGITRRVNLPNGTDGCVKEIVCGINGSGHPVNVFFTNSLSSYYTLSTGNSLKLLYVGSMGGWVAVSYTQNVNAQWD